MHRLDTVLYDHGKECFGNGVRTHVNAKENPLYRGLRGGSDPRRCITQDGVTNTLPTELFRPPNFDVNFDLYMFDR